MNHGDLTKFWKDVIPGHRHIVSAIDPDKQKRLKDRFQRNVLAPLKDIDVGTAWDWGCGGGLLSKMLVDRSIEVCLIDVCEDSLESAQRYLDNETRSSVFLQSLDNFDHGGLPKPVLIVCYNVVHHFPDLTYFSEVLNIWKAAGAIWIGISAKTGSHLSTDRYKTDYVHGLVMPQEYIEERFAPEYMTIRVEVEHSVEGEPITHFLFRRVDA